jgi:hypothetical protein
MLHLSVKAYCAHESVGNCRANAEVHAQVLRRYDIGNITSARHGWWENEQTSVLLLEDAATSEPLGAVRLQRWGNGIPLPMENAMAKVDTRVHDWVARFSNDGVGELCGLWCAPRVKGFALGAVLTRMGLSIATQLRTRTVLGVCDTRAVPANEKVGFARDRDLALDGTFEYPRPGLKAHVLRVADVEQLAGATFDDRAAIDEYRDQPVGMELIRGTAGWVALTRDLRLVSDAARTHVPVERATRRRGVGEAPALRARL